MSCTLIISKWLYPGVSSPGNNTNICPIVAYILLKAYKRAMLFNI